jgi:hypothetical protein
MIVSLIAIRTHRKATKEPKEEKAKEKATKDAQKS